MPTTPPPTPEPATVRPLPPEDFERWYGGWDPLDPSTIGEFMEGFDRPWWIIGGWSIEVFTGVSRTHEDMDVSILSSDAEAFRRFLGDRWTSRSHPDAGGRWTNKRNLEHTEDLEAITWVAPDGLRYARAEVTLMFNAAQAREKDRQDAEVALPMLDDASRRWLRDAVAAMDPHHPWLAVL